MGLYGNPGGCSIGDQFFVTYGTIQYSQIYATLLAALTAGKPIMVYSGSCTPVAWYTVASTTYNTVTSSEAVSISN